MILSYIYSNHHFSNSRTYLKRRATRGKTSYKIQTQSEYSVLFKLIFKLAFKLLVFILVCSCLAILTEDNNTLNNKYKSEEIDNLLKLFGNIKEKILNQTKAIFCNNNDTTSDYIIKIIAHIITLPINIINTCIKDNALLLNAVKIFKANIRDNHILKLSLSILLIQLFFGAIDLSGLHTTPFVTMLTLLLNMIVITVSAVMMSFEQQKLLTNIYLEYILCFVEKIFYYIVSVLQKEGIEEKGNLIPKNSHNNVLNIIYILSISLIVNFAITMIFKLIQTIISAIYTLIILIAFALMFTFTMHVITVSENKSFFAMLSEAQTNAVENIKSVYSIITNIICIPVISKLFEEVSASLKRDNKNQQDNQN